MRDELIRIRDNARFLRTSNVWDAYWVFQPEPDGEPDEAGMGPEQARAYEAALAITRDAEDVPEFRRRIQMLIDATEE